MNILSLLKERTEHPFHPYNDTWLTQLADSDGETVYIVTTETALNLHNSKNISAQVFNKYHLNAMIDLKNPYVGIGTNFFLYVFSKTPPKTIAYGIYLMTLKPVHHIHNGKTSGFELESNLPDEYVEYLNKTVLFLSNGISPEETAHYEFGFFPYSDFKPEHCNPKRYRKKVQEAYKCLQSKKSVPLGKITHIIEPKPILDDVALVASPSAWQYPVDYSSFAEGRKTNFPLQKGDILLFDHNKIFLVYEQPVKELHPGSFCKVIRTKNAEFCPEYLYYYLKSETISTIIESQEGSFSARIRVRDLSAIPVAFSEKESEYYKEKFYSEHFSYSYIKRNQILAEIESTPQTDNGNNSRLIPYCGEKDYIFISYCHKDKKRVLPIIQRLFDEGYRVWYDEGIDPGTEWDKNIAEHIVNCGYFIAFMSKNYLDSLNCKDELNFARELEKNRFLIYLEKISLPPEMQMRLGRIQNIHKYMYDNEETFFEKLMNANNLYKQKN